MIFISQAFCLAPWANFVLRGQKKLLAGLQDSAFDNFSVGSFEKKEKKADYTFGLDDYSNDADDQNYHENYRGDNDETTQNLIENIDQSDLYGESSNTYDVRYADVEEGRSAPGVYAPLVPYQEYADYRVGSSYGPGNEASYDHQMQVH